jgi:glycerol-3-phosphate acyltransferase PlsY
MRIALFAVAAYLYGALPYAYIATRLLQKQALTSAGTGNIGITNAFKVGGTAVGIIAVLGEISKALVPIFGAGFFFDGDLHITLLLVYCAFLGTSFSIFLKGKGGKGTTMAFWSLLILSPYAAVLLLVVWTIIVGIAQNNPITKTIPLVVLPVIFHVFEKDIYFTAFCILVSLTLFFNNRMRPDDYKYYHIFNAEPKRKPDADPKA